MITKIGIDLNGVLRDINLKISQIYEKNFIETYSEDYSDGIKTYTLDMSGNTELIQQKENMNFQFFQKNLVNQNPHHYFSFQNLVV